MIFVMRISGSNRDDAAMKAKILLAAFFVLAGALSGCVQQAANPETVYKFVCSDGSVADSAAQCQAPDINKEDYCKDYCPAPEQPLLTEDEITTQINSANYCATRDDCAVVDGKCPFGCHLFVNKNEAQAIAGIIQSYKQACILTCTAYKDYNCAAGKCVQILD